MRRAFVTLVTGPGYVTGARALLNSLERSGSDAARIVMHTAAVDPEPLRALADPVLVDLLPMSAEFNEAHARDKLHGAAPFTKGAKPSFHTPLDNFAKLRLWQLPFDKVVFLDADTVVLRNIDRLFDYPEFCGAPNVYESLADFHRLNSGVFTARPSEATFASMLDRLEGRFWRRTDQSFLQEFFPHWHGLPVFDNMLQYVWFNMPSLWDWASVNVVHYQYEKPWEAHDKVGRLRPLIDLWQAFAEGVPLPELKNPCA